MRAAGRCKHANMAAGCSPGWMSGTAQNPPCTSKEGQGPNRQSRAFRVRLRFRGTKAATYQDRVGTFLHEVDCHICLTSTQGLVHPFTDEQTEGCVRRT